MGTIIPFPSLTEEQISGFIRETSAEKRCVLCGSETEDNSTVVVCDQCYEHMNRVFCARCGHVHIVKDAAFQAHSAIDDLSFFCIHENGPIGFVVGACNKCDPQQLLKKIDYRVIECKNAVILGKDTEKPASEPILSAEEIDKFLDEIYEESLQTNDLDIPEPDSTESS